MLDFARLVTFIYYSKSSVTFNNIKKQLLSLSSIFEDDDLILVQDKECTTPGSFYGAVANSIKPTEKDFIKTLKETTKLVAEANLNTPKTIFVICGRFQKEYFDIVEQFKQINDSKLYPAHLVCFQTSESPIHKEILYTDNLNTEIKNILEQQC